MTTELVVENDCIELLEVGLPGPAGPPGPAGTGAVFITDVQPTASGIVGNKVFEAGTVPANIHLLSADSDTGSVTVFVTAEGGADNYTPTVDVNGTTITNFVEDPEDKRHYTGSAAITVVPTQNIVATSNAGDDDTVVFTLLGAGPEITSAILGNPPGAQTEVKSGDTVTISGVVENDATAVNVVAFGAASSGSISLGAVDSGGVGFRTFSGTVTISGNSGSLAARLQAQNVFGTTGGTFDTINTITLNQTFPGFVFNAVNYPATQNALKDSEQATVDIDVTDFDVILYESPPGHLAISSTGTYDPSKLVQRIAGDYVNTGTNYRITATRSANGAVSVGDWLVVIQHVAPEASITIDGAPTRLRSSPSGNDYVVRITADQVLQNAPSLDVDIGAWQGGGWSPSGGDYTRTLRITDAHAKGTGTFSNLVLPGLANRDGSTITAGATFTAGGFLNRTITFAAFSQFEAIGCAVADINKTVASYTGASALTLFNDLNDHFQGYSISDNVPVYDATGDQFFLTDQAFTGANTSGTLQADIEELE